MKNIILIALMLFATKTMAGDIPTISGADLLKSLKIPNDFIISVDWINAPTGCENIQGYYYLNLQTSGEVEGKPAIIQLSVQTGSEANARRIFNAIHDNVDTKGLPACLLKDQFMSQPIEVFHPYDYFLYQPISQKFCSVNGTTYGFPITSCADEAQIYP